MPKYIDFFIAKNKLYLNKSYLKMLVRSDGKFVDNPPSINLNVLDL